MRPGAGHVLAAEVTPGFADRDAHGIGPQAQRWIPRRATGPCTNASSISSSAQHRAGQRRRARRAKLHIDLGVAPTAAPLAGPHACFSARRRNPDSRATAAASLRTHPHRARHQSAGSHPAPAAAAPGPSSVSVNWGASGRRGHSRGRARVLDPLAQRRRRHVQSRRRPREVHLARDRNEIPQMNNSTKPILASGPALPTRASRVLSVNAVPPTVCAGGRARETEA